ncbi:MAG: acetyl-CoA carboxylase biotin carboxyl carrier protein subunit [Bdellovibrionota bacterium]|jgi:biotin carboxyl carrier protein
MRWRLKTETGDLVQIELLEVDGRTYRFRVGDQFIELNDPISYPFSIKTDKCRLSIESWTDRQWRASSEDQIWIVEPQSQRSSSESSESKIRSPMPGRVLKILAKEGEKVQKAQKLLIIEAMKMENEMISESEGVVKKIHVSVGQSLEPDQLLVEIEGLSDSEAT